MSFQTAITISQAIKNISANQYLLPSIQREFVWQHEKIEWLFDSIMQGYPISSFLFWKVDADTTRLFRFYSFIREFRQKYKTHNEEYPTNNRQPFTAVLDGQQRLTALYIGLCGSYAYKKPKLKDENSERVYPTRLLYLNISEPLTDDEKGKKFEFKFLTDSDFLPDENVTTSEKCYWTESKGKKTCWFKVSDIYAWSTMVDFNFIVNNRLDTFATETLVKFQQAIHVTPMINFYLEEEQNVDKALNIFIRMNSGGVPLSFSALIMSMAIAHWKTKDAKKAINDLVDSVIKDKGFTIHSDFVLKTYLYLHSSDIKFKVANFSIDNAKNFERKWEKIRDAILATFDLVQSFGFDDTTLTSKNSLLPIIYYLYHREIYMNFYTATEYVADRDSIKKWLHIALIKRIFSGQSDTMLSRIRKVFSTDVEITAISKDLNTFPVNEINHEIKKEIGITAEFIESILLTQKEHHDAFSLLALLYPNLNYKTNLFDKDHLHPISSYDDSKHNRQVFNSLKNLQLLDSNQNKSKNDQSLEDWVKEKTRENYDKKEFLARHLIPDVSLKLDDFDEFIKARTVILTEKLKSILS